MFWSNHQKILILPHQWTVNRDGLAIWVFWHCLFDRSDKPNINAQLNNLIGEAGSLSYNGNGSFTFYVDVLFIYRCQDFYWTWLYIWVARRVSYRKQELLTLLEHMSSPPVFFMGSVLLIFLVFVLSYYLSLHFEFRVVMYVILSNQFV